MQQTEREARENRCWRHVAGAVFLFVTVALCLTSFGKNQTMKKEKHFGQVYTPAYLVQDILDTVGYTADADILKKHVIDNSCGDGAFLKEIVRRYVAKFLAQDTDGRILSQQLSRYVHGIELDKDAHAACLRRLNDLAEEFGLKGVSWDVRNADTLTVRDYDGKMDFVVGNPPYVRVHNLAENYKKVKSFRFCGGGMTDLYLVFYELGLQMLSDDGVLCYIAPSSWINSLAGKNMRDYVRDNQCLRGIVDLGHYQPFDATAYTAIVTLCRGDGGREFDYGVYDGAHRVRKTCRLSYDEAFFADALYLGNKKALSVCREITLSAAPQYVQVKNGFATLADDVFIADDFPFSNCVIPVLKASTGKWRKCLFPYDVNGKPIPKDALFRDEAVRGYLTKHKETLLKGRSEADKTDWYLFGRTQALKDVPKEKYAVNTCIRDIASIKFNRVPSGSGVYSGLYILTDIDEATLRDVLLCEMFTDYIAALKKYKSGGYYTFSSRDLERYLNHTLHARLSKGKGTAEKMIREL